MSVIDFRRLRAGLTRVQAEPDLRLRGILPATSDSWHVDLCEAIASLLAALEGLTANDVRIIEAVRRAGSLRAAAKALEPQRPSYRSYIQRRMKQLRDRLSTAAR